MPVLYDPVSELKIDINIYNKIVDYLRQVHMITKKEEFDENNKIIKQLPKAGIKIKQGTSVIVYKNESL